MSRSEEERIYLLELNAQGWLTPPTPSYLHTTILPLVIPGRLLLYFVVLAQTLSAFSTCEMRVAEFWIDLRRP
jgi:hypothetical protein